MEVGQEDRRPPAVAGNLVAPQGPEPVVAGHHRDEDDHRHGRDDPSGPSCVEVEQHPHPLAPTLTQQQSGDHEPGDDEEHVNADEAAWDDLGAPAEVVDDHQRHRERPQPLDVRSKWPIRGRRARVLEVDRQLRRS